MRTVAENRAEMNSVPVNSRSGCLRLSEPPSPSRSCFYDFGARQQAGFVSCPEDEKSGFIESLVEEFCG